MWCIQFYVTNYELAVLNHIWILLMNLWDMKKLKSVSTVIFIIHSKVKKTTYFVEI